MNEPWSATILIAEDDEDDRLLVREATAEARLNAVLRFVTDGEALLDALCHGASWAAGEPSRQPDLVLLDLNLPRMDGREALAAIKSDPRLRRIPIVVWTTSSSEADIARCYDLGANSFITKPSSYTRLVEIVKVLGRYWLDLVTLPPEDPRHVHRAPSHSAD